MTADPIAGIVYPVRSVAPNITATMKPSYDQIGALIKSGLPRGGVYAPSSFSLAAATVTNLTLARVSGDTDLVSSGNLVVPATWGGVWSMTIYFQTPVAAPSRTFVNIVHLTSGRVWRTPLIVGEDRVAANVTAQLAAGDTIQVQAYSTSAVSGCTAQLDMWRLS